MPELNKNQWTLDVEKLRAAKPKHILFLCVANSARSQLAEAIARSLAPSSVRISSAGSRPTKIHALSITALKEIGIDASQQTAKAIETIDAKTVDAVITLCAEEECPLFFGESPIRIHWPLPDPARGGIEEFRVVRDLMKARLVYWFGKT